MKITYHAAQRFLERVVKKSNYSKYEVHRTIEYLQRVFKDVVVTSYKRLCPLPGFEKDYFVVLKENSVVTIIPKKG